MRIIPPKPEKKFAERCAILTAVLGFLFLLIGCGEISAPRSEPYAGSIILPRKKEFRWSNGKSPKSFDPALASAAPETDIVRAIYEGLTETDPKTLRPRPAVAVSWSSAENDRVWKFVLRKDAKWTNGQPVTAQDFVRSWERLVAMERNVKQYMLLANIEGTIRPKVEEGGYDDQLDVFADREVEPSEAQSDVAPVSDGSIQDPERPADGTAQPDALVSDEPPPPARKRGKKFGVEAVSDFELVVKLKNPDKDFPALVAHPIFRPVFDGGNEFQKDQLDKNIITNGPFRVTSLSREKIELERSDTYWDKPGIKLEKVVFVAKNDGESALAAYKNGELDAITNAVFEPLALKLLTPFDDFRRTKFSALNYYEFNTAREPFDNRKVREALSLAIDRKKISEDEMDGASYPAVSYLPLSEDAKVSVDVARARQLLTEAGYPDGRDFPLVKLLVNRNDIQKRIAQSIIKMWKKNLNIDVQVEVKEQSEVMKLAQKREFDMVRRGIVLPTADETANIMAMFPDASDHSALKETHIADSALTDLEVKPQESDTAPGKAVDDKDLPELLVSEEQANDAIPAIPLYFPASYSLVKPYVSGFETNVIDMQCLKDIAIDDGWDAGRGVRRPKEEANKN